MVVSEGTAGKARGRVSGVGNHLGKGPGQVQLFPLSTGHGGQVAMQPLFWPPGTSMLNMNMFFIKTIQGLRQNSHFSSL